MTKPEKQLWKSYRASRSVANRNALVEHYLPDLPKIIGKACPRRIRPRVTPEDVSAASLGLIAAVDKYTGRNKASFRSCLYRFVVGYVKQDRDRLPIGEEIGKRGHFIKTQMIDTTVPAEEKRPVVEVDEEKRELAETVLRSSRHMDFLLMTLSRQERRVIRLIHYEGMLNVEAARKMHLSPGRISQLRSSGIKKLRKMLSK